MSTDINRYREKIIKAIKQKDGEFGNGILYKMCQENPCHNNSDVVASKIWLIGRAYGAAIERVKEKKYINDDFYKEKVGPNLTDPALDDRLENLRKIKRITKENAGEILSTHKYLQKKIYDITGMEKRSLCSKYLHFHFPALFFIYDSRVASALQKLYPGSLKGFDNVLSGKVDKVYVTFFCKALVFKNKVEEKLKLEMTPRQIDNFLINEANEKLRMRNKKKTFSNSAKSFKYKIK